MIKIEYHRESVCAADDYYNRSQTIEMPDNAKLGDLVKFLARTSYGNYSYIPYTGGNSFWALESNIGLLAVVCDDRKRVAFPNFSRCTPLSKIGITTISGKQTNPISDTEPLEDFTDGCMELADLITDCASRQKKGIHFILASIFIWALILVVHLTNLNIAQKDILTFCCSAVLFPIAWGISKALGSDFQGKGNPLTKAGILFSVNQMLYILIAMWVLATVPQKMVMVYSMIFGAHLMPFSWLYRSKSYLVFSIIIPLLSLVVGLMYPPAVLAALMVMIEAIFAFCLNLECKKV